MSEWMEDRDEWMHNSDRQTAEEIFKQLDKNSNGSLEGMELLALSAWAWRHFYRREDSPSEVELDEVLDRILCDICLENNGEVTFFAFLDWYLKCRWDQMSVESRDSLFSSQDDGVSLMRSLDSCSVILPNDTTCTSL